MEKATVLVVDDSMSNLLLVQDILNTEDEYNVLVESDGENVVSVLNNNKVDLILLDVMMPKVDGFEVCKRVKADLAFKDIPIIFLTAKVDESSLLRGFDMGGVDYIKKPFLISELIARVRTHLQLKKTNEKLKNELFQHYLTQQSLQASQNELTVRNNIAHIFLSELDDTAYTSLLEEILKYLTLDYGVIGYFNEDNKLVCPCIYSGKIESDKTYVYDLEQIGDIALSVIKKQTIAQNNDVSPLFYTDHKVGCMVSVPVIYKNKVIGLISVAGKSKEYPDTYRTKLENIVSFISPIIYSRLETALENEKRLKAEEMLKVSEEKYRTLFNQNNDGIFVYKYDKDTDKFDFEEVNSTAANLLGYSKESIKSNNPGKFLEPIFYDKFIENLKLALNGISQTFETYVVNQSGKSIPVELHIEKFSAEGNKITLLNVMRDISFRKDIDKQLFSTIVNTQEKERARFAKDIHDGIGSYLTSLITYINLLASSKISLAEMPDTFEEMKELVMEAVTESKNIANDLMPDILNNFGLVASIKNQAKHMFVDNTMQVIFEFSNFKEPENKLLKTSLFRITCELFNNAIKYSQASKVILLLETQNNYTKLRYSDDGIGFNKDQVFNNIKDKKVSGLKNIEGRVANFNGQMEIKTDLGCGLEINILVLN